MYLKYSMRPGLVEMCHDDNKALKKCIYTGIIHMRTCIPQKIIQTIETIFIQIKNKQVRDDQGTI